MPHKDDKERLKRLKEIDSLFSCNPGRFFSGEEIEKHIVESLNREYNSDMRKRDLVALDTISGKVIKKDVSSGKKGRPIKAYGYIESANSIFNNVLSLDDKQIIKNILSCLQLKGFDNFKDFLNVRDTKGNKVSTTSYPIISFTRNPKDSDISNTLNKLFKFILEKQVVSFSLVDRKNKEIFINHEVHPWYLREYNRRWYLFGFENNDIHHYALDRIQGLNKSRKRKDYIEPTKSIDDILSNVIGISFKKEDEVEEIIFWVSDESSDFVSKKPIHESMEKIYDIEAEFKVKKEFFEKLPKKKGEFFKMNCIINYELIREMMSFRDALVVLKPNALRVDIKNILNKMLGNYV